MSSKQLRPDVQRAYRAGCWTVIVLVIVAIVFGGGYLAYKNWDKLFPPQPQVAVPVATQPQVQPTALPEAQLTAVPTAATGGGETTPPGNLPQVVVAFDAFASYYPVILIEQLDLDKKYSFDLVMVPFCSTADNCYDEQTRSEMLRSGEWDIMFTTLDKLALDPSIGQIIAIVDESDGADKIVVNPAVITTINDLRGTRISYMEGSVGEFFIDYLLHLVRIETSDVQLLPAPDVGTAASNYVNGWADAVSGWEPDVDTAVDAGGTVLISSERVRIIIDVFLASDPAIRDHPELVQAFVNAWFEALRYQFENPDAAEQLIIDWGNNDWSYVAAPGDLTGWLETIAQANLGHNAIAMQNPSLIAARLEEAKRVWQWAGKVVPDANYLDRVDPHFVLTAAQNPALQTTAQPINPSFLLTGQPDIPELTEAELGGATTLAVLPLRKISFEPDSTRLTDQAIRDLTEQVLPVLRASSDVYLKIDGSSAWPGPAGRYTEAQIRDFAYQRAVSVAQFLAGNGIDTSRLILGTRDPQYPESTDAAQLEQDRYVEFTLILPPGR